MEEEGVCGQRLVQARRPPAQWPKGVLLFSQRWELYRQSGYTCTVCASAGLGACLNCANCDCAVRDREIILGYPLCLARGIKYAESTYFSIG